MSGIYLKKRLYTCLSASKLVFLLGVVFALVAATPASAQIIAASDDFSGPSLDTGLWTFIDPIGDSSVYQANGIVTLSVPAGTSHDIWTGGNESARIVQPVTNSDLGLEVKFESLPVTPYQIQGLMLEASAGNYIRLDFFDNGTDLRLFGASFVSDSPTVRGNIIVPSGSPLWLRVVRVGNTFTVTWSDDGSVFQTGFNFNHTLALSSVGVYAGNNGTPAPAFDAVVDYFFDTNDPIVPEDGGLVDIWPPVVTNIVVVPDVNTNTALVTCTTSESATTLLSFGLTTGYGTDVVGTSGDGLNHQFALSSLMPDSLYHFSILATDTLSNSAATADQQFVNADIRPIVTFWGGLNQRVGHLGMAQVDFNLMGTVDLWDNLATLTYSLNGGPDLPLNWGLGIDDFGDHRRLARNGDFNADIPLTQLLAGANTISVHALTNNGKEDTAVATVNLETGSSPFPVNIDWSTVTDPQDVGQYVDGDWVADASGLRTATTGYDRLFLFGESTWQDYEIVCPMTINEIKDPTGPVSGKPGLGFLMRFDGHSVGGYRNWPAAQPKWGYQPWGGLGWLRWLGGPTNDPTVQFYHGDYDVTESYKASQSNERSFDPAVPPALTPFGDASMVTEFGTSDVGKVGETFFLKMRSETLPDAGNGDGVTRYSFKTWLATDSEPAAWNYQYEQQSEFALRDGAVALLAHHVDVTFGDVSIIDLTTSIPPVSQDDALTVTEGTSGVVNVLANDSDVDGVLVPNTVAVTSAPLNGTITNIDPGTGAITYLHNGGVAVADSFTYTVDDDDALTSNPSLVRVTIVPAAPPVANDDNVVAVVGGSSDFDILANDTDVGGSIDPATVNIVSGPANGVLGTPDPITGIVNYTHDGGGSVSDSFTYTVDDDLGATSNLATVFITIEAPVAPTAVDDAAFASIGSAADVNVLANDTPGNGAIDPATVTIVASPTNGMITGINPSTGVVTYTHDGGVSTADTFTYTVDDVNGATSNVATVNLTVGQIPAGQFVSDDFNNCDLDPIWTFVDPQGDSTAPTIQGAFTGDAQVAISVPGGASHELFNGTIGAPYIIQDTDDTDFTLEVKFASILPAVDFAEQGIIVRQDDANWLRLEFYTRATDQIFILSGLPNNLGFPTNELIPGLTAGTSPIYMRIERVGDTWTQSYSTDGTNWTALASFIHPITVSGVGVYGGNADTNPAHTVLVDYFSNTLAPVIEPDDTGLNSLTTMVAGNGSLSRDLPGPNYSCGDMVQLTATPDPGYAFDSWSGDLTGSVNPATVTMDGPLNITATFISAGPPEAPVANDDAMAVVIGNSVNVDVLANDTDLNANIDPGTVAIVNAPLNGTITNIDVVTGVVTYLHDGGVSVSDSFTYTVEDDGGLLSNQATVTITVDPLVAPTAVDDALSVLVGAAGDVDVLSNDTAGNGAIDPGTVTILSAPLHGLISNINGTTGVVTYTHDGGLDVSDSFTYTVDDINGATSNIATVNVTIGAIPPGEFVSDDFNSCDLNPIWTFVDPMGDSTQPTISGAYTADAQVAITVPGGSSHELYGGVINAPYIIQSTTDNDFTVEVKFDSAMPQANTAEQGIIVRQDDTNWLRLEFYTKATDVLAILAMRPNQTFPNLQDIGGTTAGSNPMYMRIQRSGDNWTQSYSLDGTNWTSLPSFTYAMNVTGVGVYGGNAGSNPAHTVLVDYFSNTLAPIADPDDATTNSLTTAVIGSGTIDRDLPGPNYACGDMVQLTANPGVGYAFDSWSGDLTGSVNPATVTMDGPLNVTATFIASGPPVAPVANDDATTVLVADTVVVDVLANDTDANGDIDPSTVVVVNAPLNGSIINIDGVTGAITYLHDGGAALADSFTYTVEDAGSLLSNEATVNITIDPLIAPTAVNDALMVLIGAAADVDVLSNDTDGNGAIDPGTVTIVSSPLHGLISNINGTTGVVTYTHDGGLDVTDSFTYTVDDINGATSNVATVDVSIGAIPPGEFVSDDFNNCDLNPIWTFVDPMGDSTQPTISGAYTADAQVAITVPGGSSHELYGGVINAPYIIQSTTDNDFTVEVKFDSAMPVDNFAEQGIIVRQDNTNWLRLEFYTQATDVLSILAMRPNETFPNNAVIGGATAGSNPMYMRIQRSGNDWTQSYSLDGTNWTALASFTYAMNVTGVGVYGGNAGNNPAHTVLVDYFSNSLAPIIDPDDTATNSITTTVIGTGTIDRDLPGPNYACGEMVQLTANTMVGFAFDSWSGDVSGNTNPLTVTMDGPLNVTATFVSTTFSTIAANTSGVVGLSTANTCEAGIPVEITRDNANNMRAFSVTLNMNNLELCNGVASIQEGTYLSSIGATTFQVVDNLDGTFDIDGSITGLPCGAVAPSGELFTIDVANTIADGTGTITFTNVGISDCDGFALAAQPGAPANIVIDSTAPVNVTGLSATQVMLGNPVGNVTGIDLAWTVSSDPSSAQTVLYRKGFGFYPEYDDAGGAAPAVPTDPIAEGWVEAATLTPVDAGFTDLTNTRDYWYFCAVSVDAYGNQSTSLITTGVLNYLLGDVSDGGAPMADGDNAVNTPDVSLMGASYGTNELDGLYLNTLDVGPTHNFSVTGRPTTDNEIEFEDLIVFSINYSLDATAMSAAVAASLAPAMVPDPADRNALSLDVPALPNVGETFVVGLEMMGDGQVQGLRIPLEWDYTVIEYVGYQAGPLLAEQGGQSLALSIEDGVLDIALVGVRELGISGIGTIAQATFRVIDTDATDLKVGLIDARDKNNDHVDVTSDTVSGAVDTPLPRVSALNDNYPNPFNPMTTISFDLAKPGRVKISIFSVDGRLVQTLVDESLAAGRHERVWQGKDTTGRTVASGTYLYRMVGPGVQATRRMLLMK